MDFIQCILLSLNFYFYPGLQGSASSHGNTFHLVLVEAVGDVPDVDNRGGVLRLLGLLLQLLPGPLPGPVFQRLRQTATQQSKTSFSRALDSHGTPGAPKSGRA